MSLMDLQLKTALIDILKTDEDLKKVNFTFDRVTIGTMHFRILASWIESGRLRCRVNAAKIPTGAEAAYDPGTDTIYAKTASVRYDPEKMILLHEATHAYLDLLGGVHGVKMTNLENETCAYLAAAMYELAMARSRHRHSAVRITVGTGASARKKAIYREAESIVKKKGLGSGSTNAGNPIHFLRPDVTKLQAAIRSSSLYPDWRQPSVLNGIPSTP